MRHIAKTAVGALVSVVLAGAACAADTVLLVENGAAKCSVVVPAKEEFDEPPEFNWGRRDKLLQWAAEDVATYLGKMSGATIAVGQEPVAGLLPIYVGRPPKEVKLANSTEFGDAYLIDVTPQRIILYGESRRAVYYAAAHLLHDLGVRWYAPSEIGEVVPKRKTVAAGVGRSEHAPDFHTRHLWCYGPDQTRWSYRNRLRGGIVPAGHSVHGYAKGLPGWGKPEERAKHPEYYAIVDGKPGRINLANPEVVRHFAANVIAAVRQGPPRGNPGGKRAFGWVSVSPDDGYLQDGRPEVRALNNGQPDPILRLPSFSDAWFGFLNAVCAEIDRQAPGLKFRLGSLAYMNYIMPPTKVKPDPRLTPIVAPIAFNRFASMGKPHAPASELLAEVMQKWAQLSPRVGVYLYSFNLADMAMPYTRRVHWTNDFPKLYHWGIRDVTIESHPGWHTMVPANYVAARILWNAKTDVTPLLDEFYPAYYGPAAKAMRRYDRALETAYESTPAFAGNVWAMHRILTPTVMHELDQALTEAEALAKPDAAAARRVGFVRASLTFAKLWFAARDAINDFQLAAAAKRGEEFLAHYQAATAASPIYFGPNRKWSPNIARYFELFHNRSFKDAGRIAREGIVVYKFPDQWQAQLEPVENGATPSTGLRNFEDAQTRPLKTFSASLDEQGLTFFRGVIWYRHRFKLPEPANVAKALKLWFGGLDRVARIWLNGQDLGEHKANNFGPLDVDISKAANRQGDNVLIVAVNNQFPNEIGTGGIVRPVLVYTPRQ